VDDAFVREEFPRVRSRHDLSWEEFPLLDEDGKVVVEQGALVRHYSHDYCLQKSIGYLLTEGRPPRRQRPTGDQTLQAKLLSLLGTDATQDYR
jgi:hypothetical protein